mgnify:CR=1 FL=1
MRLSVNPQLSPEQLERFGAEIDALRARTVADLGARDARYIRAVFAAVRYFEALGRIALMASFFLPDGWLLPAWGVGVLLLALSKILDNMELGHNVIHGQYDWMGDKHLNGKSFEWDIVGTSANWRKTHNYRHHTYTNVHGMDEDIGYGVLRLFPQQRWNAGYLLQPLYAIVFALLFEWGVAMQDVRLGRWFKGRMSARQLLTQFAPVGRKMRRQPIDYLRHIHYDCISYSPAALQFLISVVGADRVMFGTDWPHQVHDVKGAFANTARLPAPQMNAVRSGNATKLFRL